MYQKNSKPLAYFYLFSQRFYGPWWQERQIFTHMIKGLQAQQSMNILWRDGLESVYAFVLYAWKKVISQKVDFGVQGVMQEYTLTVIKNWLISGEQKDVIGKEKHPPDLNLILNKWCFMSTVLCKYIYKVIIFVNSVYLVS